MAILDASGNVAVTEHATAEYAPGEAGPATQATGAQTATDAQTADDTAEASAAATAEPPVEDFVIVTMVRRRGDSVKRVLGSVRADTGLPEEFQGQAHRLIGKNPDGSPVFADFPFPIGNAKSWDEAFGAFEQAENLHFKLLMQAEQQRQAAQAHAQNAARRAAEIAGAVHKAGLPTPRLPGVAAMPGAAGLPARRRGR